MLIGMMALLVCVPSLAVQEGSTPRQEYEAILSDHKALLTERDQALGIVVRDACERGLRGDEIKEVYQKAQAAYGYERRLEPIARRALDLARKHPEDPAALDALVWVIKRTTYLREAIALITAEMPRA